jgi:uracil-DNA glycosylase
MPMSYVAAVDAFLAATPDHGWAGLPFFASGRARDVAAAVDRRAAVAAAAGKAICPPPADLLRALHLSPRDAVRAVILGQDPYPNPRNAHGLAFSVPAGRPVPASLRTVFRALERDIGLPRPGSGDLAALATQGVMLLNAALTVEEGSPGSHADLGWADLAREIVSALSAGRQPVVFFLWGNHARKLAGDIDESVHLVLHCRHPSSMGLKAGEHGDDHPFIAFQPFRRAADWLADRGLPPIDWTLP